MSQSASLGWWTLLQVLCGLSIGLTLVTLASLCLLRRRQRAVAPPAAWPPIALLRPCEGEDPLLLENLLSSVRARYDGPRRVLVLVPSASDPACAVARAAAAFAPPGAIEVVVTGIAGGQNRKVAQLEVGAAGCPEEVLVQADSDVLLGDGDLPALIAALLADPRCGAAFASPVEARPQTLADRASAALVGCSQQNFMALYAVTAVVGGAPSLAGALCAHRREALMRIGGFAPLRRILGEDYELSRRLKAAGYRVCLSPLPASCTDGGRGLREVVARVARWLMVVRAQRPGLLLGYPLVLASTPLHILGALLLRDPIHVCMTAGLLGLRAVLAGALRRLHRQPGALRGAADVLLGELLMLAGLLRSLRDQRIVWRGHRYRVAKGGLLTAEED